MSVPVSTAVEVTGNPAEYKSGEMNSMAGDGTRKVAFITGTTGQDGSYLVELLLSKGTILFTSLADLAQIAPRSRRERRRPRSTHLTSPSEVYTNCVDDRDGRSPPRDAHLTFFDPFFSSQATLSTASSVVPPPTTTPASSTSWKRVRLRICAFSERSRPPAAPWSFPARARDRVRGAGLVEVLGTHPRRTASRAFPRRTRHLDLSPDRVRAL